MKNKLQYIAVFTCLALIGLTACNKVPDHVKYIPKDAAVVVGVDFKSLTKKVAWNAIMGSKLFQEMQKNMNGKTSAQNFEDIGIDMASTIYVYANSSKNLMDGAKVVGLIPLSDEGKLETFIKSTFPAATIKEHNKIKTAMLSNRMFAGWNDHLLMVTNASGSIKAQSNGIDSSPVNVTYQDEAELAAELEADFNIKEENSIKKNPRYIALEKERHDILLWMNYEQISDKYMSSSESMMGNLSGVRAFWKDAAFTAGLDFEKGCVASTMRYYISGDFKQLGKELGSTNVSDEVINKLPSQNMDFMLATHANTKGLRDLLDKLGVIGLANLALTDQNMDVDYILDAFTGDLAFSINDFQIKQHVHDSSAMGDMEPYESYSPAVKYTCILKINKKANFEKLLSLGKNMIKPLGNNTYSFNYGFDSVAMAYNDGYAVISNNVAAASACLQNTGKQKLPIAELYGHPVASYTDFQQILSSISPASKTGADSVALLESRKMFSNIVITGGDFNNDNFCYNFKLNFVNKDENSLIQIIDYAMKMSERNNVRAN